MNNHRQRPLAVGNLRAFEAVARLLSFSEAAEELHLTQSAVSRQIKSLEEEIGATLFLRGTRHVDLTGDNEVRNGALAFGAGAFRDLPDRSGLDAVTAQDVRRAAGGHEVEAEVGESAREGDEAGLVKNTEEC